MNISKGALTDVGLTRCIWDAWVVPRRLTGNVNECQNIMHGALPKTVWTRVMSRNPWFEYPTLPTSLKENPMFMSLAYVAIFGWLPSLQTGGFLSVPRLISWRIYSQEAATPVASAKSPKRWPRSSDRSPKQLRWNQAIEPSARKMNEFKTSTDS